MKKTGLLAIVLSCFLMNAQAQKADSLLKTLDSNNGSPEVEAVFKSTRVVLSQSTETQKKHDLDLRIRHHFGDIGGRFGSSHTLYGLDVASDLFIGFDYGITDDFTVGIGRSKQDELFNFSGKYKLLKQKSDGGMPVNLTLFAQMGWIARSPFSESEFSSYANRFSYFIQPIFSRKFSSRLSLEVLPALLMRKNTTESRDPENLFSIGFAGRMKLSKRLSFVADYTLVNGLSRPTDLSQAYFNPLGVGLEIETGGHIFSLNFMNSEYILENNFIPGTKKSWQDGGVRFGFTISRNFTLFKSKNKDPDKTSKIY
ncbi:hypothetical protein FBD94_01745 [Pedobacter hiemivivus]|jgi:hypothetical protein|uniref:DUF5777 domain-containing protein n=1 Tax=Pedobacter hiemivivus TaxID=2530454 RepID=A0A4U1GLP7_9SPHI|nr:DUF5777 family beta-barrel protein [Pedobacter hiemivivus]TKC65301.1 hypothetical protein FBD94_01745 [Pedobacter hiemivivus]